MMILVAILSETGIFDFLAVYAYKVHIYKLLFYYKLYLLSHIKHF